MTFFSFLLAKYFVKYLLILHPLKPSTCGWFFQRSTYLSTFQQTKYVYCISRTGSKYLSTISFVFIDNHWLKNFKKYIDIDSMQYHFGKLYFTKGGSRKLDDQNKIYVRTSNYCLTFYFKKRYKNDNLRLSY